MEQVTFSAEGIFKKQHELYWLSDDDLQQEAEFLRNDIIGWSRINFKLNNEQNKWLETQDNQFYVEFASKVAEALTNRWDIQFENRFPPKDPMESKIIRPVTNLGFLLILVEKRPDKY